jgi:hypothetical protein
VLFWLIPASEMADLGLDSSDVAEVMGHTTAGITERIYTHAFNREAREQRIRQAMKSGRGRLVTLASVLGVNQAFELLQFSCSPARC